MDEVIKYMKMYSTIICNNSKITRIPGGWEIRELTQPNKYSNKNGKT